MSKDVIISIKSTVSSPEPEDFEFVTTGLMTVHDGKFSISYKENEEYGMGTTQTLLEIEQSKVTVTRVGELSSRMVFERGQKHVSYYDTDAGAMTVGIITHGIDRTLSDSGGDLKIDYEVDINNAHSSENAFRMTVREMSGPDYGAN